MVLYLLGPFLTEFVQHTGTREDNVKPFTITAVALFTLIALVHLLRLVAGWEVVITGFVVPVWWSAPGLIVAACLAVLVWCEAHR